ncbi:MAG: drug/metabolite transporter (DMT)-like permease, partial [Planctomycetota bacterium]
MTLAIVSALLSAAFWAVASVAIGRFLASGIVSPAAANLFKNTTAAFMFLLGALIFGGHWPVGTAWAWLFLSGFLGFAVADTLYFAAFQRCGVQTAATVMLLNVPIATVLALPLAGDEIKTQVIPFAAVVLVGVLLVIVDSRVPKGARVIKGQSAGAGAPAGNPASDRGYGLGVLLAVVAAFAIGTSVPLGRGSFGDVSVFPGGFIRLVGGAVGAVPMAVLSGLRRNSSPSREVSRLLEPIFAAPGPGSVWGRASLIGVGCAIVGLGPYHFAQRELPSGIATTLFASTPLFTLPLAWVLGSRVGWKALVGTVVGFLGVAGILRVGQAEPPLSLGPGPEVVLTSQDAIPERQGARKPSFLRTLSPPRVRLGSDAQGGTFPFVAVAAVATGGPAESAEVGGADLRRGPIFFGERGTALPSPRRLLQSAEATDHARAHWADTPMVARLASGGLLIATQQSIGDEGFGYGVRLGFEPDGPPALDLG